DAATGPGDEHHLALDLFPHAVHDVSGQSSVFTASSIALSMLTPPSQISHGLPSCAGAESRFGALRTGYWHGESALRHPLGREWQMRYVVLPQPWSTACWKARAHCSA